MPWPESQRRAIFLDVQKRKGTKAAKTLMRKHKKGHHKMMEKTGAANPVARQGAMAAANTQMQSAYEGAGFKPGQGSDKWKRGKRKKGRYKNQATAYIRNQRLSQKTY